MTSSSPSFAARERRELADLMAELGPTAPTLCAGWDTSHLAAHLVVRDRRPDAMLGLGVEAAMGPGPLPSWAHRLEARLRESTPFAEVVARFRSGPPPWTPLAWPGLSSLNTTEFAIHHEDARRAQPDWQPRELPRDQAAGLWRQLRLAGGIALRRLKTSIQVVSPGFGEFTVGAASTSPVKLSGAPGELAMFLTGRQAHSRVELTGPQELVDRVREAKLGL